MPNTEQYSAIPVSQTTRYILAKLLQSQSITTGLRQNVKSHSSVQHCCITIKVSYHYSSRFNKVLELQSQTKTQRNRVFSLVAYTIWSVLVSPGSPINVTTMGLLSWHREVVELQKAPLDGTARFSVRVCVETTVVTTKIKTTLVNWITANNYTKQTRSNNTINMQVL